MACALCICVVVPVICVDLSSNDTNCLPGHWNTSGNPLKDEKINLHVADATFHKGPN